LGVLHRGVCRAGTTEGYAPADDLLVRGCNFGYARGFCSRFPSSGPDAVRFSIASDDGRRVQILFATEKEHLPGSHGRLVYDREEADWEEIESRTLLHEQAWAYLHSYLSSTGGGAAV
jgi:hypothetical protein